ncbi:MAG: CcmD family protein [Bacteroidota bacterium]
MKYLLSFLLFAIALSSSAASFEESMHESGKINVVIGVMLIIFTGIVVYLILMDRKVKKLEKELKDKQK